MPASPSWRCTVCGYIHAGQEPPDGCPVCGAARTDFEPYAEQPPPRQPATTARWQCLNCHYVHTGREAPAACPVCGATRGRFEALAEAAAPPAGQAGAFRVVIVGGGIAGVSAAETIRRVAPAADVTLIAADPEIPYYRLNLTRYLAGEITRDTLPVHPGSWYAEQEIRLLCGISVDRLDLASRTVVAGGREISYDKLILAMGAHPYVPPMEGAQRNGVVTLRTAGDADAILRQVRGGARCVCIGGGVLGIETAGALARQGADVSLLESHAWLMPRQLNAAAAQILERHIRGIGVKVVKQARTAGIAGGDRVTGVNLQDGRCLPADLVVVATGVRPNTALARKAGLAVNNGIVVDNHLECSVPGVYAAGDVAEHNGQSYGAWGASQYQGSIAALNAAGLPTLFGGLPRSSTLKALGLDITSIGCFEPEDGSYVVLDQEGPSAYSRFVFRDGRMIGTILVGHPAWSAPAKQAIESAADFSALLLKAPDCGAVLQRLGCR